MTVRLLPAAERTRWQQVINAAHHAWVLRQIAAGNDGPTPPDRPAKSDYNQHFADMEADGAAEDEFWGTVVADSS